MHLGSLARTLKRVRLHSVTPGTYVALTLHSPPLLFKLHANINDRTSIYVTPREQYLIVRILTKIEKHQWQKVMTHQ